MAINDNNNSKNRFFFSPMTLSFIWYKHRGYIKTFIGEFGTYVRFYVCNPYFPFLFLL